MLWESAQYRHKCFISYHHTDQKYVDGFVRLFDNLHDTFISRAVGVFSDDIIDSADTVYIMRRIREEYLSNTTVTIVLVGKCTWSRRYVDWEIASSLRNDKVNKRNGLMAITLPYVEEYGYDKKLPPRLEDNWDKKHDGTSGYAKWYKYPASANSLGSMIEDAYQARTSRYNLINNAGALFRNNRPCE